ncbi:MAG: alpha-galactosidase [Acidobacteria bacterium]|nr:alpha-galactosidase [Acidobacteriota bacterium]
MQKFSLRLLSRALFVSVLASPFAAVAADKTAASFDAEHKVFRLDGGHVSYVFGVNERGELQSVYWGGRLQAGDRFPMTHSVKGHTTFEATTSETPQEYGGWGAGLQFEPALKITFPDGNRDLVLHYQSHKLTDNGVDITLRDIQRDVRVVLHYSIDANSGIVARSATITNGTTEPFTIEQAAAATFALPRSTDYMLHYLTGRWSSEWQMNTRKIDQGETVLESRRGSTSHHNNPYFAIGRDASVSEIAGDVWFGEMGWSGSWRMTIEQDSLHQVRITGGYNPFDFAYKLAPGQSLESPIFYVGYTSGGYGEASRILHRFQLAKILPGNGHPKVRPVLYNSWEATTFNVTEQGQIALAEKAASIGVERFVMDDGWFGQRKNDHAGLGDWYVNKEKFPNGLKPLIDRVHGLGMQFGIWVEPEMVNPDSDLYRAHPDWVLHFKGRPRTEGRNQLTLNVAMPEVRDYIFKFMDDLLTKNDIQFIKWDYNRPFSEPGWEQMPPDEQKKVYVAFVDNLYSIFAELRKKHPNVEFESCSSGGGRVDLGILRYTDQVWTSDNTDAYDRVIMQEGFTQAYTPGIMMAWTTDVPNGAENRSVSLAYRFLVAMEGSLGVGDNLNKWKPEDFELAKKMIAAYKDVRNTVQHGSLYRLASVRDNAPYSATESVSIDRKQAVLFAYLHSSTLRYPYPRLFMQGLDPKAMYTIRPIYGKADKATPVTASGDYWMHVGIDVQMKGDFQASAFVFETK